MIETTCSPTGIYLAKACSSGASSMWLLVVSTARTSSVPFVYGEVDLAPDASLDPAMPARGSPTDPAVFDADAVDQQMRHTTRASVGQPHRQAIGVCSCA